MYPRPCQLTSFPNDGYTSYIPCVEGRSVITKVQKWGNSQGLRLSKSLLADADIDVGDSVDVVVQDGILLVTPVRRVRGGHDLRELVSRIPKGNESPEIDWGPAVGREAW